MATPSTEEDERATAHRDRGEPALSAEQAPLGRRLLAEFVGTLTFVGVGTGAATVIGISLAQRVEQTSGFETEELFAAFVANSFADVLAVALAFAFALAALVYALGGVSGAHFNPAVTLALAITRRFRWLEVIPYWIAQCAGAVAAAFVVAAIYGQNGASVDGTDILFGATVVASDIGRAQALVAEAFCAFVLVTAIMGIAVDHRAPKGWSGLVIGIALAAGILATGAATGGSANFARSLGPFVASLAYDTSSIPWADLLVYALGPAIGAAVAALVYESLTGLERAAPAPEPGAATPETARADAPAG